MKLCMLLLRQWLWLGLLVASVAVCSGMNGCSDYEVQLPKGYDLTRTNADTVAIWGPVGGIVVPPKITGLEVSGNIVYGVAEVSPDADVPSVAGFFILDCENGAVRVGLSEAEWRAALQDLGIVPRPLRKPSKWFRWSGPRAP